VKVLWVHKCNTAVSQYRMWTPAKYLARLPGWSCMTFPQWLTMDRLIQVQTKHQDWYLPTLAGNADLVIYGWFGSGIEQRVLTGLRRAVNVPSLIELDDDVFNVPEGHGAHEVFKKVDPASCWEHRPIPPEAWRTMTMRGWGLQRGPEGQLIASRMIRGDFHTDFQETLKVVNGLTVSTPFLAEAYRQYVPEKWPIYTLPNCYDPEVWDPVGRTPERPDPTLVWAGSMAHSRNLEMIVPALKRVFKEEPRAKLVILGSDLPVFEKLPKDRLEFAGWCHYDEYPAKLASLGGWVGLAPLEDNPFNAGKSHIRWMEYALAGMPSVCSPRREYLAWAGASALWAETSDEWAAHLLTLIQNERTRWDFGQEARAAVGRCDIRKHVTTWADALTDAVQKGVSMFGTAAHLHDESEPAAAASTGVPES